MRIYFPATISILTPAHIKCLRWLVNYKNQKHPDIIIGLLTEKALKGYKKSVLPFKDRKYILETIAEGIRDRFDMHCVRVVSQNSLDPYNNIKKYRPVALASGDGWEKCELEAIKKCKLLKIDIPLPKVYSSTAILKKICQKQES